MSGALTTIGAPRKWGQSRQVASDHLERVRVSNGQQRLRLRSTQNAKGDEPENEQSGGSASAGHEALLSFVKPSRSLEAVAVSNSGMTFASARTGMKFVSPPHRGIT